MSAHAPGMSAAQDWADWNRQFEQWTAAIRRHDELKQYARAMAELDRGVAARLREAAAQQRTVVRTREKGMRALMVALLARGEAP